MYTIYRFRGFAKNTSPRYQRKKKTQWKKKRSKVNQRILNTYADYGNQPINLYFGPVYVVVADFFPTIYYYPI